MDAISEFLAQSGPDFETSRFLSDAQIRDLAKRQNIPLKAAMLDLLARDVWPERFRRNSGVITASQQAKILSLRVFIAGCGGLGGEIAALLCRMGAGAFRLCDPDVFEESNLNRQRFCVESAIGQSKAEIVAAGLRRIASYIEIEALPIAATEENLPRLLADMDIAVDGLDSVGLKKLLEREAAKAGVPYLHGSVLDLEGFAWLDIPAKSRLAALYPDALSGEKAAAPTPVLAPTVSGTACLMAALLLSGLILDAETESPLFHLDFSAPALDIFSV